MEDLKLIEVALDKATQKGAFTLSESFTIVQALQKVAVIVLQEGVKQSPPPVIEEPHQTSSE
jgi:hypothetical protein